MYKTSVAQPKSFINHRSHDREPSEDTCVISSSLDIRTFTLGFSSKKLQTDGKLERSLPHQASMTWLAAPHSTMLSAG